MSGLTLPGAFNYQPQFSVDIDRDSPYTNGLLLANTPQHGLKNAVQGYPDLAIVGAPTRVNGPAGIGHSGLDASNYLTWVPPTGLTAGTVMVVTDRPSGGVASCPWFIGSSTASVDLYPYSNDGIYMGAWANTRYISNVAVPGGVSTLLKPNVLVAVGSTTANTHACYKDGVLIGSANATFAYASTMRFGTISGNVYQGKFYLIAIWNRILPKIAIDALALNPWQIFKFPDQQLAWDAAAAGGTHASSGALTSDSATIAGSGTHVALHPSSGALSASDAVVSGSATRVGLRPSSGALSAGDAITAGSATRYGLRPSSGDLTAQSASVAGTAAHIGIHQSSGDLTSGSAVIDGTGTETPAPGNTHPSSGALSAGSAGIAGTAAHIALHPSSGALSADNATVAGIAAHIGIHASSGALEAQSAVVSGSAINGIARNSSGGYLVETLSEKRRLRRHLEEAQEVVQRIKKPSVSQDAAEALQEDAAEISRQLKASIAELEAVAENYQKQLDQKASFKAFAAKQEAKEQARQIQALMIDAQIHAELAQQQIEELDVVFMAFALMAYV